MESAPNEKVEPHKEAPRPNPHQQGDAPVLPHLVLWLRLLLVLVALLPQHQPRKKEPTQPQKATKDERVTQEGHTPDNATQDHNRTPIKNLESDPFYIETLFCTDRSAAIVSCPEVWLSLNGAATGSKLVGARQAPRVANTPRVLELHVRVRVALLGDTKIRTSIPDSTR